MIDDRLRCVDQARAVFTAVTPPTTDAGGQAATWFARYQSGSLTTEDHRAFQAWLDQSPENRQAYDRLNLIWTNAPPGLGVARPISPARKPAFVVPRFVPLAGMGAVAALLLLGLVLSSNASYPTYRAAMGERLAVTLPDKSHVDLNTSTTVEIHTSKRLREVRLVQGEAFFTVTPDTRRPFVVTTSEGITARAVGTEFAVRSHGGAVSLVVLSGKVEIFRGAGAVNPILVTAGQAVEYPVMGSPGSVRAVKADQITAWRHGKLVFEDVALAQALQEINRYRQQKIEIVDAPLSALRVGGVFSIDRSYELIRQLAVRGYLRAQTSPDGTVRLYNP